MFYMSKEGELMYWGGEYQKDLVVVHQRRAVQFNAHIISTSTDRAFTTTAGNPSLAFRIVAGAPLRSRCQWGRLIVRGSGALRRKIQNKDFLSNFSFFDSWTRFYLSLDDFGLHLFENKFMTKPVYIIPIIDLKSVTVDLLAPVRQNPSNNAKSIVEDINNVILTTLSGDEIFIRFPDAGSRVAWQEVFSNAIAFSQKSMSSTRRQAGWFSNGIVVLGNKLSPVKDRNRPDKHASSPMLLLENRDRDCDSDIDEDDSNDNDESGTRQIQAPPTAIISRSRMPPIFAVPHKSKLQS